MDSSIAITRILFMTLGEIMGFYNDRPDYDKSDAESGVLGEKLYLRYCNDIYKNDKNIVVQYEHKAKDTKKVGDILIYDIENDFILVKEVERRSIKDFSSLQKYYLISHNLMTKELEEKYKDVKLLVYGGIHVPDKSFNLLKSNEYTIYNPVDESILMKRCLTNKEIRAAMYVIVSEEDDHSEFPTKMIEVKINQIIKSITGLSTNRRQENEKFYELGYNVAKYVTVEEKTNEKIYYAD